jgi:LacI family transcriptional regulator
MLEAGLTVDPSLQFEGNYSRTSGYDIAAKVWEIRDQVEAVFAANDRMAIGLMQGLRERGWIAGRDYAVIGCDDSDAAKLSDPPLSSIKVPFFEMGKGAARAVLASIGQGSSETQLQVKLPTEVKIRQSSKWISQE